MPDLEIDNSPAPLQDNDDMFVDSDSSGGDQPMEDLHRMLASLPTAVRLTRPARRRSPRHTRLGQASIIPRSRRRSICQSDLLFAVQQTVHLAMSAYRVAEQTNTTVQHLTAQVLGLTEALSRNALPTSHSQPPSSPQLPHPTQQPSQPPSNLQSSTPHTPTLTPILPQLLPLLVSPLPLPLPLALALAQAPGRALIRAPGTKVRPCAPGLSHPQFLHPSSATTAVPAPHPLVSALSAGPLPYLHPTAAAPSRAMSHTTLTQHRGPTTFSLYGTASSSPSAVLTAQYSLSPWTASRTKAASLVTRCAAWPLCSRNPWRRTLR